MGQIEYGSGYKKLEYVPVSKDLISKKSNRLETLENMYWRGLAIRNFYNSVINDFFSLRATFFFKTGRPGHVIIQRLYKIATAVK